MVVIYKFLGCLRHLVFDVSGKRIGLNSNMKPLDRLEILITKYLVMQDRIPEEQIPHTRLYEINKKNSPSYFLTLLDHKLKSVNPVKLEAMYKVKI